MEVPRIQKVVVNIGVGEALIMLKPWMLQLLT